VRPAGPAAPGRSQFRRQARTHYIAPSPNRRARTAIAYKLVYDRPKSIGPRSASFFFATSAVPSCRAYCYIPHVRAGPGLRTSRERRLLNAPNYLAESRECAILPVASGPNPLPANSVATGPAKPSSRNRRPSPAMELAKRPSGYGFLPRTVYFRLHGQGSDDDRNRRDGRARKTPRMAFCRGAFLRIADESVGLLSLSAHTNPPICRAGLKVLAGPRQPCEDSEVRGIGRGFWGRGRGVSSERGCTEQLPVRNTLRFGRTLRVAVRNGQMRCLDCVSIADSWPVPAGGMEHGRGTRRCLEGGRLRTDCHTAVL